MSINQQNLIEIQKNLKNKKNCDLLIVTKNQSKEDILELLEKGFYLFGENRVQEAIKKYENIRLKYPKIKLHLIGPLQTNKTKLAIELFDVIQTIDRKKLIDQISNLITNNKHFLNKDFFIQVNIGQEQQKNGAQPQDTKDLYEYSLAKGLSIKGLMCIPPANNEPEIYFKKLKDIRNSIDARLSLSMGMSNDYQAAVNEGSNLIRVGSLIFQ